MYCDGGVQEAVPGDLPAGIFDCLLPDTAALAGCAGTVYVPNNSDDSRHIAMRNDGEMNAESENIQ